MTQVPHLNRLWKEHERDGLVVVGVTNEEPEKVWKSVEKHRMQFPIALVEGRAADRAFGVRGFPTSVLVDASGNVVWSGHPAGLPKAKLLDLLQGRSPIQPLPPRFDAINRLLSSERLGAAHAAIVKARKKSPGERDLARAQKEIEKLLADRRAEAERALEAEHWGEATALLAEIERQFAGLPEAVEARKAREAVEQKPEAAKPIAAWRLLRRALDRREAGDRPAARDLLQAVTEVYPDTHAAAEARRALAKL